MLLISYIVHYILHGICHFAEGYMIIFYVTSMPFYACVISLHFSYFKHHGSTLFKI